MDIQFHSDIKEFCEFCFPFLEVNEAANNLLLGILNTLKENIHTYSEVESPVLISISDNSDIELISLRTPPYNQIISYTENLETIPILVETLAEKRTEIPGILGFKEGALKFAQLWAEKQGKQFSIQMHERIYQLEKVNPQTMETHDFGLATNSDKELICKWTEAFIVEALPPSSPERVINRQKRIEQDVNRKKIYVLKVNGQIVSMARKAGTSPNGQGISNVYTPPQNRRKGYATELMAKLSQTILNEGKKYCFLFTDLTNPTSNKIYQEVGYEPVIDIDVYKFE